jgi:regulator of nucleoside diphosphate kinase
MLALKNPPVRIVAADYDRLTSLAGGSGAPGAALLRDELARATVIESPRSGRRFARLGSRVAYVDLTSRRRRSVVLVTPELADMEVERLSVLTPAGAALIGLSAGDAFHWTGDDGRSRGVEVLAVEDGS